MNTTTRIEKVELIGPTAVGVYLADDNGQCDRPAVISPNNFITAFGTFLTALRAAGATGPVEERRFLDESWQEARKMLQKRLAEGQPWGRRVAPSPPATDEPPNYWAMVLCMGEEGAQRLLKAQREKAALTSK
jgi:hypothetical protein